MKRPSLFWYVVRAMLCMMWALPWMLAAFVLAASIVGIPLAAVAVAIGVAPYVRNERKRITALADWKHRDHPYQEDEEPPWETFH